MPPANSPTRASSPPTVRPLARVLPLLPLLPLPVHCKRDRAVGSTPRLHLMLAD